MFATAPLSGSPLDCLDGLTLGLDHIHEAGMDRLFIEQHETGAAPPYLAPKVSAGEPQLLAKEVSKARPVVPQAR